MSLGRILREIFAPSKEGSEFKESLSSLQEQERRLNRCLEILDGKTFQSVKEASEEAANFDGN